MVLILHDRITTSEFFKPPEQLYSFQSLSIKSFHVLSMSLRVVFWSIDIRKINDVFKRCVQFEGKKFDIFRSEMNSLSNTNNIHITNKELNTVDRYKMKKSSEICGPICEIAHRTGETSAFTSLQRV